MDPEQTFLRVHARLSGMLVQLLTPRIRMALEHMSLVLSLALLGILVVMHVNFVAQPGCANELSGSNIIESQLVQIKITSGGLWSQRMTELSQTNAAGQTHSLESFQFQEVDGDGLTFLSAKFWLNWIGSGARRSKGMSKLLKSSEGILDSQPKGVSEGTICNAIGKQMDVRVGPEMAQREFLSSGRDSFRAAISQILDKWNRNNSAFFKGIKQFVFSGSEIWKIAGWELLMDLPKSLRMLRWRRLDSLLVQWLERKNKASEPTYLYTVEKGYFMLPEGAKLRHNVQTINVSISTQNVCFGNRWQQLLINSFIGYDTILMNSLLNARGQGYLYNFQTKELYDLSYLQESTGAPLRIEDYLVSKCGVLIMSLFVFFTTTMSVSFTLRETQARMLKFTVQLQHHARHHLPTFQLIFVHVIESLVFVPIMIGILFFLFEFYDDQLLAFMVLTLVWLCELFTMISVRTPMSMQYFPRFFLLYFLAFHIYFFSYTYGFSYLAFSAAAAFMQHLVLYFWNHFEVPALQRFLQQRTQLQPQPGVQITSSAILTSTFHFTRLNARNANLVSEFGGQQATINQLEESNFDGNGGIFQYGGTSLGGSREGSSLHRNALDGDRTIDVQSVDGNQVRIAYTGGIETIDQQSRQTANRRVHTDSTRINPDTMQNNELTGNDTSGGPVQQTTGLDLQQTARTAASVMNPNPLMSVLLWILGGSSDGLVSFFPMLRDFRDQGAANADSSDQENQQHVRNSWWRGSSSWEGLRQRNGHSVEA